MNAVAVNQSQSIRVIFEVCVGRLNESHLSVLGI